MSKVFLVLWSPRIQGAPWEISKVFATREAAEDYIKRIQPRPEISKLDYAIEEWDVIQ